MLAGVRSYLKFLPFFLLPAVHRFTPRQLQSAAHVAARAGAPADAARAVPAVRRVRGFHAHGRPREGHADGLERLEHVHGGDDRRRRRVLSARPLEARSSGRALCLAVPPHHDQRDESHAVAAARRAAGARAADAGQGAPVTQGRARRRRRAARRHGVRLRLQLSDPVPRVSPARSASTSRAANRFGTTSTRVPPTRTSRTSAASTASRLRSNTRAKIR